MSVCSECGTFGTVSPSDLSLGRSLAFQEVVHEKNCRLRLPLSSDRDVSGVDANNATDQNQPSECDHCRCRRLAAHAPAALLGCERNPAGRRLTAHAAASLLACERNPAGRRLTAHAAASLLGCERNPAGRRLTAHAAASLLACERNPAGRRLAAPAAASLLACERNPAGRRL